MSVGSPTGGTDIVEECAECERATAHEVSIELRTENPDSENASFSREPYRVAECQRCGETTTERCQ